MKGVQSYFEMTLFIGKMIYFFLSTITSILGSLIGIGGGVILRPMLKFFNETSLTAAALSTFTVFSMALLSSYKYGKQNLIDYKAGLKIGILIIPASFIGTRAIYLVPEKAINVIYVVILFILICFMIFRKKIKKVKINKFLKIFLVFMIGFGAGILGIGGGPFLIPLLLFVFHIDEKRLFGTSVFIVLLTSFLSLVQHAYEFNIDYMKAFPLAIGAFLGSVVGTGINKKVSSDVVIRIYNIVMILLFLGGIFIVFSKK